MSERIDAKLTTSALGKAIRNEYETQSEDRASTSKFIEKVYNQKRLRSALGYLPRVELEQALALNKLPNWLSHFPNRSVHLILRFNQPTALVTKFPIFFVSLDVLDSSFRISSSKEDLV